MKKGAFGSPSTTVANFNYLLTATRCLRCWEGLNVLQRFSQRILQPKPTRYHNFKLRNYIVNWIIMTWKSGKHLYVTYGGLQWERSRYTLLMRPNVQNSCPVKCLPGFLVIIIVILSCHQHGYPWPSLTIPPYRSSFPAGPQGYIPYLYRATVCRGELVALPLLGHVKGFIGVHHLWARPDSSSCVLHVWFV